jgi:hypothetical protein
LTLLLGGCIREGVRSFRQRGRCVGCRSGNIIAFCLISAHLFVRSRSRYVPSRGATYAEETSDNNKGIRINTTAYIMAKEWLLMFIDHVTRVESPKTLENERMTGKKILAEIKVRRCSNERRKWIAKPLSLTTTNVQEHDCSPLDLSLDCIWTSNSIGDPKG